MRWEIKRGKTRPANERGMSRIERMREKYALEELWLEKRWADGNIQGYRIGQSAPQKRAAGNAPLLKVLGIMRTNERTGFVLSIEGRGTSVSVWAK